MNKSKSKTFEYFINLDERGEFYADVRFKDRTILEIRSDDNGEISAIQDGWMEHGEDLRGLCEYLNHLGIMYPQDRLIKGAK